MANIGVPDARELEGRKNGGNLPARPTFQSRDFFWDSVTLFVIGATLALSAIDVISEFVRGSRLQCFFDRSAVTGSFENVDEYVNEKCAASLPPAEYLPAFLVVNALAILAPHYLWLNIVGAKLDSFFHLASKLSRTKDPKTGDYPEENYVIWKQLDGFSATNSMFWSYLAKLIFQVLFSIGGLSLVVGLFRDFDDTFPCPGNGTDTIVSDDWPLKGENATCVFSSLRLLHIIWVLDIILLTVAICCLIFAIVWLVTNHMKELGLKKVAKFSFQTSLPFHLYTSPLVIFKGRSDLSKTAYNILSLIPSFSIGESKSYRIQSDYDFLLVKLFRTDGGLAEVLREVHLLRLLKDYNHVELARVSSHKALARTTLTEDEKKEMVDTEFLKKDIGWTNFKSIEKHERVKTDTALLLPPTIRGVVLGLSARCFGIKKPDSGANPPLILCGALCIVFDTESIGFAGALARVFKRVAVINFSKNYSDYEKPACVNVNNSSLVLSMTVPHDIIMTDSEIKTEVITGDESPEAMRAVTIFYDDFVEEIWKPGFIYTKRQDDFRAARGEEDTNKHHNLTKYMTNYIVVGPISNDLQKVTVNMFLRRNKRFLTKKAVMVTITPTKISGVKVDSEQFPAFKPFGFEELPHNAPDPEQVKAQNQPAQPPAQPQAQPPSIYSWPQSLSDEIRNKVQDTSVKDRTTGDTRSKFSSVKDWMVTTGDTRSKFRFSLFIRKELERQQPAQAGCVTQGETGAKPGQTGHTASQTSDTDTGSD